MASSYDSLFKDAFTDNATSALGNFSGKKSCPVVMAYSREGYFIPTLFKHFITGQLDPRHNTDFVITVSIQPPVQRKTLLSIIRELYKGSSVYYTNPRIWKKIDTGKGYGYYGTKGLILDDHYKPLLICGYKVIKVEGIYKPVKPICMVSPDVFNREDMISKCIVKKIIPYYSLHKTSEGEDIQVMISSEINNLIHTCVPPISTDVDDALYRILDMELSDLPDTL